MTQLLERPLAPAVTLDALSVHDTLQERLGSLGARPEQELDLANPELVEVGRTGPHLLLVLDESVQPTGAFKANGLAVAVRAILRDNPDVETFYNGTAGNAGAGVAWAARSQGRRAVLHTPSTLTAAKRDNIRAYGGAVLADHATVTDAITEAELQADLDPTGVFLHPFDNLDAIAGQGLVGRRIARGLTERDLQGPVEVLIQRGGGSLLAGVASVLYANSFADLRVHEVRPELVDDELDPRYDGLAVHEPGSYAGALIRDEHFVHDTIYVNEVETGLAALRIARSQVLPGKMYEPSGLAGVAAFEQLAAQTKEPTTFVAVLSGANVSHETYTDFTGAPGRAQNRLLRGLAQTSLPRENSPTQNVLRIASSPTADFRATR